MNKSLTKYIKRGSLMGLQEYFLESTNGFETLVAISNGQPVAGMQPTVREILDAWKIIMDKSLPSLQATHVTQDHTVSAQMKEIDPDIIMQDFEKLKEQVGNMKLVPLQ